MSADLLRTTLAMLAAAALVLVGVVGVAALVLPEAPNDGGEAASGPTTSTNPAGTSGPDSAPAPQEAPALPGGTVQMSGDRDLTVTFDESQGGPQEDSRFLLDANGDSLMLRPDPDEGFHLDQATLDGLNFFLDPDDCSFTEVGLSEETGLTTLEISCSEIDDIQGNNTVSVDGHIYVPILIAFPDRYPTGGTVTVTGDYEVALELEGAFWSVHHEWDPQRHEITSTSHSFNSLEFDDAGAAARGLGFNVSADGEVTLDTVSPDFETTIAVDPCPVTVEDLGKVGPYTDYLEVTIDCPQMTGTVRTDPDEVSVTISVQGSLRAQRQDSEQAFFSN